MEKVWHPDRGWQKNLILNVAVRHCHGDYLIFCDGDTIPRRDFIESHLKHARSRTFLSASAIDVPKHVYDNFTDSHITDNQIFKPSFLARGWPESNKHSLRLQPGRLEKTLNLITWRYCVLRGANFSLWRDDIESVNGFDESYGYGSEDRELGVRLRNTGVASRWLKFSLIQLHLSHTRTRYRDPNIVQMQRWKFRKLFFTQKTQLADGLATACERSLATPESQYIHTSEKTWHASRLFFVSSHLNQLLISRHYQRGVPPSHCTTLPSSRMSTSS
ncbi:galactosyltransferase-related protein [Pirellulales bacterium]|nr:galactosyltransferase-related protein [Pirellulales bacterium]